jgi:hypothetical protein
MRPELDTTEDGDRCQRDKGGEKESDRHERKADEGQHEQESAQQEPEPAERDEAKDETLLIFRHGRARNLCICTPGPLHFGTVLCVPAVAPTTGTLSEVGA